MLWGLNPLSQLESFQSGGETWEAANSSQLCMSSVFVFYFLKLIFPVLDNSLSHLRRSRVSQKSKWPACVHWCSWLVGILDSTKSKLWLNLHRCLLPLHPGGGSTSKQGEVFDHLFPFSLGPQSSAAPCPKPEAFWMYFACSSAGLIRRAHLIPVTQLEPEANSRYVLQRRTAH